MYAGHSLNTGLADFLLVLACEPRTRQKALPHLGRLLVNMPAGVEGRGELLLDPLVRGYLAGKEDHLKLDGSLWRKAAAPDFSRQDVVTEKIFSLARSDVPEVGITAVLLAHRMFLSRELIQATDHVRQTLPESSLWREFFQIFYMDAEDVDTLLAFDPGKFVALLRLERSLYRPPLRGVVDAVWRILQSDAAMREQKEQGWSGSERYRTLDAAERARLAALSGSRAAGRRRVSRSLRAGPFPEVCSGEPRRRGGWRRCGRGGAVMAGGGTARLSGELFFLFFVFSFSEWRLLPGMGGRSPARRGAWGERGRPLYTPCTPVLPAWR